MLSSFRPYVVWLTASAFLCASVGDGALHLLLNFRAFPASGGSSCVQTGPHFACCALHAAKAGERHDQRSHVEPVLSAEEDAPRHDAATCPICQFTALAKSAQAPFAPLPFLLPVGEAAVARPVFFLTRNRAQHLPRGPPQPHGQSIG